MPNPHEVFGYDMPENVGRTLQDGRYRKNRFNVLIAEHVQPYAALLGTIDHPLKDLVVPPDYDNFYPTKVCNIFIACVPYGWKLVDGAFEADWPPEGYNDYVESHKKTFKYFDTYETHVWTDFNIVSILESTGDDNPYRMIMNATKGYMEQMCNDLKDFGFKYEGEIMTEVDQSFFFPVLDKFYKSGLK